MPLNEAFRNADALSLPVPNSTAPGAPVLVGGLKGITQTGTDASGNPIGVGNPVGSATVWLKGAHVVTVTGAITAIGQPIYIDGSNNLTTTVGSNTLWGHALTLKGSGSGTATVRIARA